MYLGNYVVGQLHFFSYFKVITFKPTNFMKKTYDVANVTYNTNTGRSSFKVNE